MKKHFFFVLILAISIFLAACSQQIPQEKVFVELETLSDEELEAVLVSPDALTGMLSAETARALAALTWQECSDSDLTANKNGKNLLVKGAVRINYSKQGFQRFMTYVDYCLNTSHLREYYCKKEGEGYGRLTMSCPEIRQRSCAGGACF
ncbi:MAG TPA: hypothetical protein VJC21_02935 [Candidatus Nanoarchaeia archaeon]|nr:hypothetical protein [Candidatus Nanoarchaeia archaeon]